MKRKSQKIIFAVIILFVCIGLGLAATASYLNRPVDSIPEEGVIFSVKKGETLSDVSERLEEESLIKSAFFLKLLSKFRRTENSIKTGSYSMQTGFSTTDIHDLLISGVQTLVRVTVPEGWTLGMIAGLLEQKDICDREDFIKVANSARMVNELNIPGESVEGYLFPDTYFFPVNHPAESIITTMVSTFFKNIGEILPDFADWKKIELHRQIILASIVEREYRMAEEAPIIASVFNNRLKFNIGLESCATIVYVITEINGKPHPNVINRADTKIDSPYNTYKWHGLPPGPISNPGKLALNATFHSAVSDYFYFVLKDPNTGEHHFSEDLNEHNQMKYFYSKGVTTY